MIDLLLIFFASIPFVIGFSVAWFVSLMQIVVGFLWAAFAEGWERGRW